MEEKMLLSGDAGPMRITHVIVGLNVGGAELMLKRLVDASCCGSEVTHDVISLTEVGVVGEQIRSCGVAVRALGMRSARDAPRVLVELIKIFRTSRPDIVQTWMYHADFLGGLAARIAGNRNVIWGIRTTDVEAGGTGATIFLMRICARMSRWVPRVIVCAAEASRRVHEKVGYDGSRMTVIPNGFEMSRLIAKPDDRTTMRSRCGFQSGDVVIGTLGRFNPAKDQRNFVRAAGIVAREHADARFLLVGRGLDASNEELNCWINETGFRERFVLLGERSDVTECLSAMDVFCLSSRTEGFPNVVGEAMAMCLPCVVTEVGDAAMLVADTGIVVPKEDSPALAAGLKEMLELDPTGRSALGIKAKKRITAEFTIERTRQRFESIYKSLTEK
jgi:glycosyltransferase involved in cell wall biosynthesis